MVRCNHYGQCRRAASSWCSTCKHNDHAKKDYYSPIEQPWRTYWWPYTWTGTNTTSTGNDTWYTATTDGSGTTTWISPENRYEQVLSDFYDEVEKNFSCEKDESDTCDCTTN